MLSAQNRPESIAEKIAVTVCYKTGLKASYDQDGKRVHMQYGAIRTTGGIPLRIDPLNLDAIWKNNSSVERVIIRNGDICAILYSAPLFDKSGGKTWNGETGGIKVQVADKGLGRKIIICLFLAIAACFLAPYKSSREG